MATRFVLRELYPRRGRLLGQPERGPWRRGDKVSLPIKGPQAMVLEVVPAAAVQLPALLGAAGQAALDGESLTLTGVEGDDGHDRRPDRPAAAGEEGHLAPRERPPVDQLRAAAMNG